jgi:NAD(P)-dependent dehydrogenase (short-subunit alcohol dehydrogenase family)
MIATVTNPQTEAATRNPWSVVGSTLGIRKWNSLEAEEVEAALDNAFGAFGRLDFPFNNAGVEQPITAPADITEDEWDRIARINLRDGFLCMKYEIPHMLKNGGIVNNCRAQESKAKPPAAL